MRKILCALVTSFCLMQLSAIASESSDAKLTKHSNQSAREKESIAISCSFRGSPCGTGAAMLLDGMGDPYGTPLRLEYRDSEIADISSEWKNWHKGVEAEINSQLQKVQERIKADDKLIICEVTCHVTPNGQIMNLKVETACPPEPFHSRKSPNCPLPSFEKLALEEVQSLEGLPCLKFPAGSKEVYVTVSGRFSQNYGPRFIRAKKEEKPS